jgi:serine/threonine protein kinase
MSMRESVARYRIVSTLGRGAMGLVYLADDPLLNRRVAIKVVDIPDDGSKREVQHERLLRDAKAVANLSHPNIVNVHDVVEEDGSAFIVMEFIEGASLSSHLQNRPVPEPAFVIQVLRQMASALDYAHSKGVIHRDVKPGNVMLSSDGSAKIVDFGIARISDTRTSTPTGFMVGTAAYMSPEQFTGGAIDGRADQYALAAVAYEMLTGGTLFGEQTLPAMAYKTVHEIPPPVSSRNAALRPSVDIAMTKALAKSPADRYGTCSEFVHALEESISGGTLRVSSLAAAPPAASPERPAAFLWAGALGALILGGAALAIWKPWVRPSNPATIIAAVAPAAPSVAPDPAPPPPTVKSEPDQASDRAPNQAPVPAHPKAIQPVKPETPPAPSVAVENETPFRRGQDQLKARDYPGAIQSFSAVIARHPKNAQAFYNRGQAHQFLQENDAAIQDYNESIRLKPAEPLPYVGRGICNTRFHRDDDAFADFNRALDLRADLPMALNGRGGVFARRRQYERAIQDFTAAINLNPHLAIAYRNRAAAKQALGDTTGANADRKAADSAKGQETQ